MSVDVLTPSTEKVIDTKKKPSNSGPSSFAGLLTCLNERDQQNSRSCGPPTLPDFFSGSPQDQPSPSTSQGKSSSTSQGKKRKPVSLDSGRVKRPKTAPTSADFWPEPGAPFFDVFNIQAFQTMTTSNFQRADQPKDHNERSQLEPSQ